jgi:DNA-binding FadR family transcriptional regulator
MSPSNVLKPTYRKLKHDLMSGIWPIGARTLRLADEFGVSMTPVRDSLNRLTGERLVDLRPGEGFSVARLGERALRDMLEFTAALLIFAIHARTAAASAEPIGQDGDIAERTATLFLAIADGSENSLLCETISSLNDRLHAVRRLDQVLFGDCEAELGRIYAAHLAGGDTAQLCSLLLSYHERRRHAVPLYIEQLCRGT